MIKYEPAIGPLPKFLERKPGDTGRKMRAQRKAPWKPTKVMREASEKTEAKRQIDADRPLVLAAVKDGADTFGKIRKATGLETKTINKALRHYLKNRYVFKIGRRYEAP